MISFLDPLDLVFPRLSFPSVALSLHLCLSIPPFLSFISRCRFCSSSYQRHYFCLQPTSAISSVFSPRLIQTLGGHGYGMVILASKSQTTTTTLARATTSVTSSAARGTMPPCIMPTKWKWSQPKRDNERTSPTSPSSIYIARPFDKPFHCQITATIQKRLSSLLHVCR